MHTFRHACQCWQFTSMMMLDGCISNSPFPDLLLTNQFLADRRGLAKSVFGHDRPTAKRAYMQAALAGHASFSASTARSYIHMFPWLLASILETSPLMSVPEYLVKLASGRAESTRRAWGEAGIHNIAVQLLIHRYHNDRVFIPEAARNPLGEMPTVSSLEELWNLLWRHATCDSIIDPDPAMWPVLERAREVADMKLMSGAYRHQMEKSNPNPDKRLACPARPRRQDEIRQSYIWERTCRAQSDLVRDGLRIYVGRMIEDGWVHFATGSDTEEAKRYVRFLYEIGFNRNAEVVARSGEIEEWKARLGYQGADLCWSSAQLRAKWSLSIRPVLDGAKDITYAGFNFALVMAFIRYGITAQ